MSNYRIVKCCQLCLYVQFMGTAHRYREAGWRLFCTVHDHDCVPWGICDHYKHYKEESTDKDLHGVEI